MNHHEVWRGVVPTALAWTVALAMSGAGLAAESTPPPPPPRPAARIPDVELVDQYGKKHRFFTDLVKGRLILMNAMYTTCHGSCPIQTRIFAQSQALLKEHVRGEVQILSLSLDPNTDSPEKLRAFAERHGAGPGWLFLTGKREDVVSVLKAMDLYAADPQAHTPICVVGNEPSGVWTKMINLTSPGDIVRRLQYVASLQAPPSR